MIGSILLCCYWKAILYLYLPVTIITDLCINKLFPQRHLHVNDPFFRIRNLDHMLNGIVQRITKNRTDIRHMHELQKLSICHTGKSDLMTVDQRHLSI